MHCATAHHVPKALVRGGYRTGIGSCQRAAGQQRSNSGVRPVAGTGRFVAARMAVVRRSLRSGQAFLGENRVHDIFAASAVRRDRHPAGGCVGVAGRGTDESACADYTGPRRFQPAVVRPASNADAPGDAGTDTDPRRGAHRRGIGNANANAAGQCDACGPADTACHANAPSHADAPARADADPQPLIGADCGSGSAHQPGTTRVRAAPRRHGGSRNARARRPGEGWFGRLDRRRCGAPRHHRGRYLVASPARCSGCDRGGATRGRAGAAATRTRTRTCGEARHARTIDCGTRRTRARRDGVATTPRGPQPAERHG